MNGDEWRRIDPVLEIDPESEDACERAECAIETSAVSKSRIIEIFFTIHLCRR